MRLALALKAVEVEEDEAREDDGEVAKDVAEGDQVAEDGLVAGVAPGKRPWDVGELQQNLAE